MQKKVIGMDYLDVVSSDSLRPHDLTRGSSRGQPEFFLMDMVGPSTQKEIGFSEIQQKASEACGI